MQVNGQTLPIEICLLQKLAHVDSVVQLIDYFEKPDSFIVVMDRPDPCKDLFDYITEKGVLDESEARDFLCQVLKTLVEVHKAGVIHRDIKDENLLVEMDTMRIKLIDFGSGTLYKETLYTEFEGAVDYFDIFVIIMIIRWTALFVFVYFFFAIQRSLFKSICFIVNQTNVYNIVINNVLT